MNKEEYLNDLAQYRSKLDAQEMALKDIPNCPDWAHLFAVDIVSPGEFRIDIPFNPKMLVEFRRLLGQAWTFVSRQVCDDGDIIRFYNHKALNILLKVVLDVNHDKSVTSLDTLMIMQAAVGHITLNK